MSLIYALINPETDEPYYVGLTINVDLREETHLKLNPIPQTRKLLQWGLVPLFEVLCEYDEVCLNIAEKAWINRMLDHGYLLCNRKGLTQIRFVSDDDNYRVRMGDSVIMLRPPITVEGWEDE